MLSVEDSKPIFEEEERFHSEFEVIEKIGKGGFASVYKVRNKLDQNIYAIKKIKLLPNNIYRNNLQQCKKGLEKVLKEARFLSRINHQNILRYYGSWIEKIEKGGQDPCTTQKHTKVQKQKISCNSQVEDSLEDSESEKSYYSNTSKSAISSKESSLNKQSSMQQSSDSLNSIYSNSSKDSSNNSEKDNNESDSYFLDSNKADNNSLRKSSSFEEEEEKWFKSDSNHNHGNKMYDFDSTALKKQMLKNRSLQQLESEDKLAQTIQATPVKLSKAVQKDNAGNSPIISFLYSGYQNNQNNKSKKNQANEYEMNFQQHLKPTTQEFKILTTTPLKRYQSAQKQKIDFFQFEQFEESKQQSFPKNKSPPQRFLERHAKTPTKKGYGMNFFPLPMSRKQSCSIQIDEIMSMDENQMTKIKYLIVYIQTEICDGTLQHYLENKLLKLKNIQSKPKEEEKSILKQLEIESIIIIDQILQGLSHVHDQYYSVHRDIKPQNILINNKNSIEVKIGDFGLIRDIQKFSPDRSSPLGDFMQNPLMERQYLGKAKLEAELLNFQLDDNDEDNEFELLIEEETKEEFKPQKLIQQKEKVPHQSNFRSFITENVGTIGYASPEQLQARSQDFDERADIYSLGFVIFQLYYPMYTQMEKHKVFKNMREQQDPEKKLPDGFVKKYPKLAKLILKMVSTIPNERPQLQEIKRFFSNYRKYNLFDPNELGQVLFKSEESDEWCKYWLKIMNQQLFFFKTKLSKKASFFYQIKDCNLSLIAYKKDKEECSKLIDSVNKDNYEEKTAKPKRKKSYDQDSTNHSLTTFQTPIFLKDQKLDSRQIQIDHNIQYGGTIRTCQQGLDHTLQLYKHITNCFKINKNIFMCT